MLSIIICVYQKYTISIFCSFSQINSFSRAGQHWALLHLQPLALFKTSQAGEGKPQESRSNEIVFYFHSRCCVQGQTSNSEYCWILCTEEDIEYCWPAREEDILMANAFARASEMLKTTTIWIYSKSSEDLQQEMNVRESIWFENWQCENEEELGSSNRIISGFCYSFSTSIHDEWFHHTYF